MQSVHIPTVQQQWWRLPAMLTGIISVWFVTVMLVIQQPTLNQQTQQQLWQISAKTLSNTTAPLAWVDMVPAKAEKPKAVASTRAEQELRIALKEMKTELTERRELQQSAHGVAAVQTGGVDALQEAAAKDAQIASRFQEVLDQYAQVEGIKTHNDVEFTGSVLREILEDEVESFIFKLQLAGQVGSYVGNRVTGASSAAE